MAVLAQVTVNTKNGTAQRDFWWLAIDQLQPTEHSPLTTHTQSPNGAVDGNNISIVSQSIAGDSQHACTTQQYLDRTDNADRCRYSCDTTKTVRATSKATATADFRGHAVQGAITRQASIAGFNKAYCNFADVFFFILFTISFLHTRLTSVLLLQRKKKFRDVSRILQMALYRPKLQIKLNHFIFQ